MKDSLKTGFSFGLTSGVITTLGLMIGLNAGTGSKLVVVGGILTIAVADAFSDALGIHISEESQNHHTDREIWESTGATFLSKFIFASSFVLPVLIFSLSSAIFISIIWGFLLLGIATFFMAKQAKIKPSKVVGEHLVIALAVIVFSHFVGQLVARVFT